MRLIISEGRIVTPEVTLSGKTLVAEGKKIKSIVSEQVHSAVEDIMIDAQGLWVTPGLIDIHVHGAVGFDTMDATQEAIHEMGRFFAKNGVTSYLPTTVSAAREEIWCAIENLTHCPQPEDGAQHLGVHIEGPFLNPEHGGAQAERFLRDADPSEYRLWLDSGVVKLISIAPERDGALEFIREGSAQGVEFAIAHSSASYEQVIEAADHGLRQATHTFNGMKGLHHRNPGTVGAVLTDDRIYAQLIADGVHVHPAVIDLLARAKGVERTILITDAIRATGLKDGEYILGGDQIIVKDGVSRTLSGGLAGSTLTLDAALRNMMSFSGLPFSKVLGMVTSVPSRAMGWYGRKGALLPGADADITLFDEQFQVVMTIVSGHIVYSREERKGDEL